MPQESLRVIGEGTNKAYAAVDVAVFDPLLSNDVSLDRVVFALAGIRMPEMFYEYFGTHRLLIGNGGTFTESEAIAKSRDAQNIERVFKNALLKTWTFGIRGVEEAKNENANKKNDGAQSIYKLGKAKETIQSLLTSNNEKQIKSNLRSGGYIQRHGDDPIEPSAIEVVIKKAFADLHAGLIQEVELDSAKRASVYLNEVVERVAGGSAEQYKLKKVAKDTFAGWEKESLFRKAAKEGLDSNEFSDLVVLLEKVKNVFKKEFTDFADKKKITDATGKTKLDPAMHSSYAANHFLSKVFKVADDTAFCFTQGHLNSAVIRFQQYRSVSCLGMMHRYRQHYFYGPLLRGKCNEIRSIGPYEVLEIITESTRSKAVEEILTSEVEVTQTSEITTKDSIDLSERVANTVARSSTTNISASGSYNAIAWNASGSASTSVTSSTNSSTENITKRLSEITKKQAETIRKKTTVSTRITNTSTDRTTRRHAIENKTADPLVLGLYSVGHKIETQVQTLRSSLVWQSRIDNPGKLLARSQALDLLVVPAKVGFKRSTRNVKITTSNRSKQWSVPLADQIIKTFEAEIPADSALRATEHYRVARRLIDFFVADSTTLELDSPSNTYENGKDITTPISVKLKPVKAKYASHILTTPRAGGSSGWTSDDSGSVRIAKPGSELPMSTGCECKVTTVAYQPNTEYDNTFTLNFELNFAVPIVLSLGDEFKPGDPFLEKAKKEKAQNYLQEQLSRDLKRDRADLFFEERKVILANKIAKLYEGIPGFTSESSALQLLYLRIRETFDLDQLFYDVNTFEYKAGFTIAKDDYKEHSVYNIHSKMENAKNVPVGSSLNWEIQIDGDFKRNMFLNAPFAWVCLPVKAGKETEAQKLLEDFGLIVDKETRFEEINRDLKILRAFERVFPIPPDVKEYRAEKPLQQSTLIRDFREWAEKPGTEHSTEHRELQKQAEVRRGFWASIWAAICALFESNERESPSKASPSLATMTKPEELEKAVAEFIKIKNIRASDVYAVTSAFDTFVPIDGVAIEKVALQ